MSEEHTLGPFVGFSIDTTTADHLAIEHINRKLLKEERSLQQTCWFDYFDLHPTVATYWFAECYKQAYRAITAKRDDVDRAQYVQGFKGSGDVFEVNGKELTGFWKARQNADRYGIPYDFYAQKVMAHADKNLWRRLPRPTQFYNKEITEIVVALWEEETRARIRLPEHPSFQLQSFTGEPHQVRFHEWLCERVLSKPSPEFALGQFGYIDPILPIEVIERAFSKSLIQRAVKLAA